MKPGRIASLDGLRTLSILLVFFGHLYGAAGYRQDGLTQFLAHYAHFGVQVFFVISGFLITTLLLKERETTGTVHLLAFYRRRTLRIFPACFFYVSVVALLGHVGYLGYAYSYTMCYAGQGRPWLLGHLWSLSVEEQFYLLWPFVVALAFTMHRRIAIAVVLAAPVARLVFWHYGLRDIDEYFPAVADSIAAGCLLACYHPAIQRRMSWATRPAVFATLVLVALATPFLFFRVRLQIAFGGIPPLIIGVCIFAAIERRDLILNNRVTAIGGALSYSLYLWQQPFLNRTALHWWTAFPANIGLALLCATASYHLVEKPFLRLNGKQLTAARLELAK